jgi:hypothetical protein
MAIRIVPYGAEHVAEVKDFNRRLQAGGAPPDHIFSETHIPAWLPATPGALVYNEFYLALDGEAVRGAYVLKHQKFSFRGEVRPVAFYHHPFSEGIVNKSYTQVGLQMLMHVIRAHPVLYALGMGGYDRPLPRMLMALQWHHTLVPFYFLVKHPARFLRKIQALRGGRARKLAADLAAFSGAGWAGIKATQAILGWRGLREWADVSEGEEFGDWADELWRECAPPHAMIGVRDAPALRTLYPASNPRFIRLRVRDGARTAGWAVVAETQMQGHEQYGDLRVGTILDCMARPEDTTKVMAAAARALLARDVDVLTSNQSHGAWVSAMRECGFFKGPSNFIFAASPKLAEMIGPFDQCVPLSHLNRGDGDSLLQYSG